MSTSDPSSTLREQPSQTAGPYVHIGLTPRVVGIDGFGEDFGTKLIRGPVAGQEITISGRVLDGDGAPITDALIEIWQADAEGRFPKDATGPFTGWGRAAAAQETAAYSFHTVKPGAVPGPDGQAQAPHITFWIAARGINIGLHTRAYFEDEAAANAADPLLCALPDPARRPTLIAKRLSEGAYGFDIRVQGPGETVFLDM